VHRLQVSDLEADDFCAVYADLQPHGQHGAMAQPLDDGRIKDMLLTETERPVLLSPNDWLVL
jgi:hypothetical protein